MQAKRNPGEAAQLGKLQPLPQLRDQWLWLHTATLSKISGRGHTPPPVSALTFLFLVTRLELSQLLVSESCFFPAGSCLSSAFLGRLPFPRGWGILVRRSRVIFTTKLVGGGESLSGESNLVSLNGNRSLSLRPSSWAITACWQPLILTPPLPLLLLDGPWL